MVRKGTYFHYIQFANNLTSRGVVRPKLDIYVQPVSGSLIIKDAHLFI